MLLGVVIAKVPSLSMKNLQNITRKIVKYGLLVLIVQLKRNRVNNSMLVVFQHLGMVMYEKLFFFANLAKRKILHLTLYVTVLVL